MNRGTDPSCSFPLLSPPLPLAPILAGVTALAISLLFVLPLSSTFSRSGHSVPLAPSPSFPLRVFLALARSLVHPSSPSLFPSRSQHMDAALARAPKGRSRRCRRVDERFVGARGRDQTHRPLPPFPRAVTRPRLHRPSVCPSVRLLVRSFLCSDLSPPQSLSPVPYLRVLSSFFPPGIIRRTFGRESPSKTDRRRLAGAAKERLAALARGKTVL